MYMTSNENIFISGVTILVLAILIYHNAFANGKATCNHYILNVYLYISLAFAILACSSLVLEDRLSNNPSNMVRFYQKYALPAFIISFIVLFGIYFTENVILSNLLWLLFISTLTITFFPVYNILRHQHIFMRTTISVALMVLILTGVAFWKPNYISLSWESGLSAALLGGVVLQLVQVFFGKSDNAYNKLLSYGFVLLFSLYLLYDTKVLQVKAANCNKLLAKNIYPNYPRESLGIFLDILNLFTNIGSINSDES